MGTFDGPGLRLVVFLQGCNFQCLYCANPDTIPIGKGGKLIEEGEVLRRALSERPFFGKRGGITFSGGEPTVQAEALIPLCRQLLAEGISFGRETAPASKTAGRRHPMREGVGHGDEDVALLAPPDYCVQTTGEYCSSIS